jgi:uncharacterized protein (DUF4415 family)
MPPTKQSPGFTPGRGYSQQDWEEVSENPFWTAEGLAEGKSFAELFPDFAKGLAEERAIVAGDPDLNKVVAIDRRVVEKFQSQGDDWREPINEILRKAVGL